MFQALIRDSRGTEVQKFQLLHVFQVFETRIGQPGIIQVQPFQARQSLQWFDTGVGQSDAPQIQLFQFTQSGQMFHPGIREQAVFTQVQFFQLGDFCENCQTIVRDLIL